LALFGFLAYVKLSDYDKAIDFFNAHYAQGDPGQTLFVLLTWLNVLHRKDLWKREYEKAIQAGVKPGESLSTAYHHIQYPLAPVYLLVWPFDSLPLERLWAISVPK
jgi:hypothetical protein